MECLSFDRNSETFNNVEHDHVPRFLPDLKCGWAYAVQGIDYSDKYQSSKSEKKHSSNLSGYGRPR